MNTIYFDDIGSLSSKFPSLTVYLDSPILLRALGLAPEPVRVAAEEMLEMLRGFGVPLRVFPHTIDEMSGILERVAQNLRRGKQRMLTQGGAGGRNREVIDALVKKGWTSGEIDAMQADLGNHLSAMGVEIEDTPPHVEKDHIDERRFSEILDEEVAYPTKPPLEKDLKSLAAVDRLRGNGRPRELGRAGAIFVTDNASVARASALFFKEADRKAPVPHCMLDTALTAQLWVRSAHRRPDLPRKLLIASSYAALSPGPELWERWIEHIIRVRERGDVTDEQVQSLIYHSQAKVVLFEVTHGDAGAIDEETVTEVLRRFERDLRRPAESKAVEADQRAEAAERERQQIVDRLEAAEKDAREARAEKKALAGDITSLSQRVTEQENVLERRKARRAHVRKVAAILLAIAGLAAAAILILLGAVSGIWPITGVVIGGIGIFILGLALAFGWKKGWFALGAVALVVGLIAGVQQIVEKAEGDGPVKATPSP